MPDDIDQLKTIKSQALAELAAGDCKPSYSIDGQQVAWNEYFEHLMRRVDWCQRQLQTLEPFEHDTQAFT